MPVDYYPQKSIEDLLAILQKLQDRQTKGGITEVLAAGVRTTREFQKAGTSRVDTEIRRVLYSLHLRAQGTDAATLAKYPNPYASMIRRTRARYSFS
jgi:hypothetical protein